MKSKQPKPLRSTAIAILRGGSGVHKDQMKKADPKQIRKDKSYKEDHS